MVYFSEYLILSAVVFFYTSRSKVKCAAVHSNFSGLHSHAFFMLLEPQCLQDFLNALETNFVIRTVEQDCRVSLIIILHIKTNYPIQSFGVELGLFASVRDLLSAQ